jgi:hypothetical protein
MRDLDALIARARDATVDREAAERYVRELDRGARPVTARRRWVPWLAAGLAAAAVVAFVMLRGGDEAGALTPVQLGDRPAVRDRWRGAREWPKDALAAAACELRCRALRQLGRGDECSVAIPP